MIPNLKTPNIARGLRTMRAWRGISQEALAVKSGYSSGAICGWEAGRLRPGFRVRRNLSAALYFPDTMLDSIAYCDDMLERAIMGSSPLSRYSVILDRDELAGLVGVATTTIHKWTVSGHLKPLKDGRYRWYTGVDLATANRLAAKRHGRKADTK